MDDLKQCEQMVESMKHSQETLRQEVTEFNVLQEEINELQRVAQTDLKAQNTLQQLNKIMQSDQYRQSQEKLLSMTSKLEAQVESLQQEFKVRPTPEDTSATEAARLKVKKSRRRFA